jgi:hypothetical protein
MAQALLTYETIDSHQIELLKQGKSVDEISQQIS